MSRQFSLRVPARERPTEERPNSLRMVTAEYPTAVEAANLKAAPALRCAERDARVWGINRKNVGLALENNNQALYRPMSEGGVPRTARNLYLFAEVAALLGVPADQVICGMPDIPAVPKEAALKNLRRLAKVVEADGPAPRAWCERRVAEIEGRR